MLKRKSWLVLPALLALLVPVALAGEGHYKCDKSTQECLDMMAAKMAKKGWLGIELDGSKETGELSVKKVVSDSPAEKAGLKAGDVLVAMDGVAFANDANKEKLEKMWQSMTPGKKVTYTVSRYGKKQEVTATLAKLPNEILAQWIGNHMLEHANTDKIASN